MYEPLFEVLGVIVDALRRNPLARICVTASSFFITGVALILLAVPPFLLQRDVTNIIKDIAPGIAGFSFFVLILGLTSYTPVKINGRGLFTVELESLREERKEIRKRLERQPKPDVLDTIQLSLNQLTEYYAINKSQARNSFRFSVFAVVMGLATLFAGIWLFYLDASPNVEMTAISGLASVLIQFIGGAYFYLYRKSLEQLNYFFSELVKMQDTMLSVRLCEQISPKPRQNEIRERVILTLLERSSCTPQSVSKEPQAQSQPLADESKSQNSGANNIGETSA